MEAMDLKSGAEISKCKDYRYALWRTWDEEKPRVVFVCLNPSTADENINDPTLNKCIRYAKSWDNGKYGGVLILNLFAFRATKPANMKKADDPIGTDNNNRLRKLPRTTDLIVAAWGNHGAFNRRSKVVLEMLPDVHYLKLNKTGEPSHPLYLKKDIKPIPMVK